MKVEKVMTLLRGRHVQRFVAIIILSSLRISLEFSPLVNMGGYSAPIVLDNEDGERQDIGLRYAVAIISGLITIVLAVQSVVPKKRPLFIFPLSPS